MKLSKTSSRDSFQRALGWLARRDYSRLELKRKLRQCAYLDEEINNTLTRLATEGWQNEERFVECLVRTRTNAGYGPRRILVELEQHQIAQDLISKYIIQDNDYWMAQLTRVSAKKRKDKGRAQLIRFLLNRGFDPSMVMTVAVGVKD